MKDDNPEAPLMVSIRCITYNHERYIRKCLEGFIMQKTNFRFEAIVHDDASTDNTVSIIKEYAEKYPKIIKPIYEKENLYSKGNGSITRLMDSLCVGKYVAICEGDDYWTDPYKLQKQVDYMEAHWDCSLIHTRFSFLRDSIGQFEEESQSHNLITTSFLSQNKSLIAYEILDVEKYRIQTMTALYRRAAYLKIKDDLYNEFGFFLMGDTPLWLRLLSVGDIVYLSDNTAVYRIVTESASKSKDISKALRFALSCEEMRYYYAKLFGLKEDAFYIRYLKALFKYRMVDKTYTTNPQILVRKEPIVFTCITKNKLFMRLVLMGYKFKQKVKK